jgi:hypothetical protein
MRSAKQIMNEGRFDSFAEAAPHPDINGFFRDDMANRTDL